MSEQFDLFLDSLVFCSPLPFIVFSTLSGSNWAMKGICVLTCLYLYYFLGVLSSPFYGFGFHLQSADSQMYFSSPNLSPEFQTYILNCLLMTPPLGCLSKSHLKLRIKSELLIFSPDLLPLWCSQGKHLRVMFNSSFFHILSSCISKILPSPSSEHI